jgi:ATPase subunit of ABC transporter with duplicated ATPase domains
MRGRPKEIIQEPSPTKFERRFEDEDTIEIWKYDLKKFDKGPIEVNITYKAGAEKRLKQRAKDTKQEKKIARQMKKIEANGNKANKKTRNTKR